MEKIISVLGATGSVGTQALSVASARGYRIDLMTAGKNYRDAEIYARQHLPRTVVMADEEAGRALRTALADTSVRVLFGTDALLSEIGESSAETVVNSIMGEAGLLPTLSVIRSGKRLALANKESLVIAGEIVMREARERGVEILPVDSEHSAIFQSLAAGKRSEIKRLILTASGGPFFGYSRERLRTVTLGETLSHPTWKMGQRITVDSATLMNKGFEVIEAAHLFGIPPSQIKVVVHRESILHSAVEYIDNTVIGEMSVPDMRACVQYAVDYPDRTEATIPELDLVSIGRLSFYEPDTEAFPLLSLAASAAARGGAATAVLNAADEVAVDGFLRERIGFYEISELVTETVERLSHLGASSVEELIASDREARNITKGLIGAK